MTVDPTRAKAVFFAASSLASEDERAAFLNHQCAGDTQLRVRVEALLAAADWPIRLPDVSLFRPDAGAGADETADVALCEKYKLLERIGEGGMGTVWLAQQFEPVRRWVAIKLIKLGMDSRQVLTRFEAERQALALMEHPNIAKVFDGGLTRDGRPFFVMELVKGTPITEYCDGCKFSLKERLDLFVAVCQAIDHAHQKGIIHRDIKPANILVALYDERPVPKVIDFGVAKATGRQLTDETINTGFGGVIGTPQYMSPEQATLNNLDIDTRSDIYSLGVVLYELLAGSPPFTKQDLEQKGFVEMLRVVREDEPPKPSTRLSTAAALRLHSANRSAEPRKLAQMLRSELDWVVLKAIDKNPARRYETASGLAMDIKRYLGSQPVLAHPPSAVYRMRKFFRRNRPRLLTAAVAVMALVAGIAGGAALVSHQLPAKTLHTESRQFAQGSIGFLVGPDSPPAVGVIPHDGRYALYEGSTNIATIVVPMLSGDKVGFLKNKDDSIAAVYMADGVQKTLNLSSGTVDACWTDLDQPPVVVGTVLTATPGVNYVILHWTAVRGAVKWKILRSTGTDSNWTEIANDVTSQFNAFSDATVINGTLYFYKVQGLNDKGAVVVTSNQTGGWRPQLPPAAPTLTAVAGDATVSLKWSWPKGATCTDVLRSFSHDGPWIEIADGYTSGNYTYIDRNVVNGTTYFYKIKHVNNNTTPGADSNVVGGITPQRNPAAIESEHATR